MVGNLTGWGLLMYAESISCDEDAKQYWRKKVPPDIPACWFVGPAADQVNFILFMPGVRPPTECGRPLSEPE